MRALLSVVALLVVLALVGLLVVRQTRQTLLPATGPASGAPLPAGPGAAQAQRLQQQIKDDVTRALEQGAEQRREATEP